MITGAAVSGGVPAQIGQCMYTSYLPLASEPNLNVLHALLLNVLSVSPLYAEAMVLTCHPGGFEKDVPGPGMSMMVSAVYVAAGKERNNMIPNIAVEPKVLVKLRRVILNISNLLVYGRVPSEAPAHRRYCLIAWHPAAMPPSIRGLGQ